MLRFLKNRISDISSVKYLFLLLCAAFLMTLGIGNTFSYVMTKTPTLVNMFLNGMNPYGDLVLQKTVSHPYGDLYTIPSNLAFTFEVNMGTEYANETVKTTQGGMIANENGSITVTVVPGGRTTIHDIDEGTFVTVTEVLPGIGFAPDAATKTLTIQKHQDNILTVHNTYIPEKADTSDLSVSGHKTLVGREWMEGDSFTFALEVKENGEWRSLGAQTVTYELVEQSDPTNPEKTIKVPKTDFDKFDFTELIRSYSFSNAGSYSFRVSEIEGSIGGVTYDRAESKFDVFVGDADMDGYLEIQSIITTSVNTVVEGSTVSIGFENSYAPTGSTEAFIELQKNMEDTSGQNKSTAEYTFELYDATGNLLLSSDPTGTTGETSIRLVYEPTDAGKTFDYVLKESRCGETVGALTYDDTTYSLKVTVVDNLDGTVSAYIYDSDFIWNNSVTANNAENVDSDTLSDVMEADASGNSDAETDEYTDNPTNELDTVSSGDTMTDSDNESEEQEENISSDTDIDSADLAADLSTVSDGDAGGIDASEEAGEIDTSEYADTREQVSVPAGLTNTIQKTFTNHYDPEDASVVISGKKTLTGREMNPGEFAFQLYQTDASYVIQEGSQPIRTAVNGTEELFAFDALGFDKVGTSYYVVKEDASADIGGITYDGSSYLVKVVVTDTEGVLHAEVSITDAYGKASEILFKNSYKAAPVYLPLNGRKTVNGAVPQDWVFRFLLFAADEAYNPQGQGIQTVTNSTTGEFSFETLTFRDADIYRYVVTEQMGTVEGMTYDGSKYCIYVQVTDPGDGQLVISEFYITKDGNVVSDIVFSNTYMEPDIPDEPDEPDEPANPIIPDEPIEPDKPDNPVIPEEPTEPDKPTEMDEPTDTVQPDQPMPPKTGDDSNVMLCSIWMIISIYMLLLVIGRNKK